MWQGLVSTRTHTRTIERAWIRPRLDGYLSFQTEGSHTVRAGLFSHDPPVRRLDHVNRLFCCALSGSRAIK